MQIRPEPGSYRFGTPVCLRLRLKHARDAEMMEYHMCVPLKNMGPRVVSTDVGIEVIMTRSFQSSVHNELQQWPVRFLREYFDRGPLS